MPANTTPIFTLTPRFESITFASGSGTTPTTIYTAGVNGGRVTAVVVNSAEAVANDLFLYVDTGSGERRLHYLEVPAGAGTNGTTQCASALTDANATYLPHDNNDNPYINLPASAELMVSLGVNATADVQITVLAEDY